MVDFEGNSLSIEDIEIGDYVLARSEFDAAGPLELKRVEEKFVRVAPVMELVVRGQVITTTAEHPFYVAGEERFVPAGELTVDDRLIDSQGRPVAIEAIRVTDRLITVYNLRVADFHTYFVGGRLWQFDAWVHNASYRKMAGDAPSSAVARRPGGYRAGDTDAHGLMSPGANRAPGHANTASDGLVQSHHGIQRAWAKRNIKGYDEDAAPGILLKSNSGEVHAKLSAAQRARRRQPGGWDTDIRTEFNVSYRELISSGFSPKEAQRVLKQNYKYFDSIGAFK